MSVEVNPISGSSLPRRAKTKMMGSRFVYRWICLAFVCLALGWYILSLKLNRSFFTLSAARSDWTLSDPLIRGIHEDITFREAHAPFANNLFPVDPASVKTVLFWTAFFGVSDSRATLGKGLFEGCPVKQCEATGDRSRLDSASAVIYHVFDIDPKNIPPKKDKRYNVFLIGESPANIGNRIPDMPEHFFDMIYSYRTDSDILGHYMYNVPLETSRRNFAEGKNKLAAWFVSNCETPSRRENYVKELQKFVPVDVYGKCGPLKCPRSDPYACEAKLRTEYKFYLAFENSICQDYITEKFTMALRSYVVPIVLGAGNMTIYPPHSYIHVDDFPTVKALADHLVYLDKNDTAYNEYHEWRYDKVQVTSHGRFSPANGNWCKLCEALHDPAYRPPGYKDARKHYIETGRCRAGKW